MPYWWRPYRRRWRRTWRRRPRKAFRRRYFWRRRQYRVRRPKRKLKKITLKQWQPTTIKKLTIRGQYPLFSGTTERIGNNNTTYIDTIVPQDYPGGGLFSMTVFTLAGLYELHQKARNWWTKSNCNLPLIRYQGCTIKIYASPTVDSVTVYVNCGELKATEKMYQSCQPSILMLNRNKKVLQARNFKNKKRPYRKFFIKPPALLLNKWYFQKEIAQYPLCMIISSAMSLDRYYLAASSISETMGFTSLNTKFFKLHNFKRKSVTPYTPDGEFYIFTAPPHANWRTTKVKDLMLLGNTLDFDTGIKFSEITGYTDGSWNTVVSDYLKKKTNWGNPFTPIYFGAEEDQMICLLNVPATSSILNTLQQKQPNQNAENQGFIAPTKPFTIHCRYNPQADMGHNATFVTNLETDNAPWHTPGDTHLYTAGLPLWSLLFGWHDYLKKSGTPQRLETDYIQVIVSDYISPTDYDYYVPLDWFFLNGRSPYAEEKHIKPYDQINWHPKINCQVQSIAHILQSGPATVKLPSMISCESHITYKFHFKVGGCPPAMDEVCDPQRQPQYPQPGNLLSSILLQNPETPIQYYLQSFDQRRDMLTLRAAKRLKKDEEFKETVFKSPGTTLLDFQPTSPQTTSEENSSSEEESEKTPELQLQRHRRKQRKLQRGILQLLKLAQSIK